MAEQPNNIPKNQKFSAPQMFYDLLGSPAFGPGEDPNLFCVLVEQMLETIRPKDFVEYLYTVDLINLTWELIRLRLIKEAVKAQGRSVAVEALLFREYLSDAPVGAEQFARVQTKAEYKNWRLDTGKREKIEARLNKGSGGDDFAIMAQSYILNQSMFDALDKSIAFAQHRRMLIFREIDGRREFAKRCRRASDEALANNIPKLLPT
ncbi:hypothetical protein ASC80_02715 [Afipia sp. Root123D2]|uniref:hypothetical protein n=1 Tax=Afipia sp. Root123D2 TaxID=1736436 RepID=UPI00070079CA|nr:hypothetical protein [Afipia sp. Root123D2]KQW22324.1 hypothetical protein ASC80_02715 [Afipia sp. Root123D2]